MKWTDKSPSEPGHYWVKYTTTNRPVTVARVISNQGKLYANTTDDVIDGLVDNISGVIWSEAIPEPEE